MIREMILGLWEHPAYPDIDDNGCPVGVECPYNCDFESYCPFRATDNCVLERLHEQAARGLK